MNSAMMMQSPHRQVLEATPDTDESKAKLLEELQSRGRSAVGAKSWMDAKLLYEKALTLTSKKDADQNRIAILNSNLSLVLKNMGPDFMEEARKAAVAATEADPTYVKGWWRLGQALQNLQRSSEAVKSLEMAGGLDPTNKALIKELEKVRQKAIEEEKLAKEKAAQMELDKQEDNTPPPKPVTTLPSSTSTTTKKSSNTSKTKPDKMNVDDDDKIFTKSDAVRGYKIVNGKKTSYFHNELSEEAKTLIGDIAPKKLETPATPAESGDAKGGVSAWNKAGTWEEKDLTKWAKSTLTESIENTIYVLPDSSPAPGAQVTVSKVKTMDGHASCALARGKKRYIYEFMVKLEWKLEGAASSSDALECTGSLALPDIDGTIELGEGYEIHEFQIDSVSENSVRPLIERFVQRGGFSESLNESIDNWVRRFKDEY